MNIKKVGVVGCGLMGAGIVEVSARCGYDTLVMEINEELLEVGLSRIKKSMSRALEKGKLQESEMKDALEHIRGTTNIEEFSERDIVVEAIIENMDEKKKLFKKLDEITPNDTILATNTSSLCITEIGSVTSRPDKVIGLHFFNPVPVMKLLEIVRTINTSDETFNIAKSFGESLGKKVVVAKDTPGFIVNLLLIPYLLDAIRAVENDVATVEDIDQAMVLGCGHPMGPLTLLDFVGLDTTYYIAKIMHEEFGDPKYAPPPLLKRMVLSGKLGRKAGEGFYKYNK